MALIGIVNVDFIQDVNFYTGGFSAAYGDRLSSIMDLTFREGNRDEFDGQLELNFAGSGIILEGPILKKQGSVFFSARRSFVDLLVDAVGTGVAPKFSDYQGKLVYDITQNNKMSVLNILGIDHIGFTRDDAEDMGSSVYGDTDVLENSFGVNWQSLWSKDGYSNTSVSHIAVDYKTDFTEIAKNTRLFKNESFEQIFQFRNVNYYRLNESNQIEFGLDVKHFISNYDYFYADYTDTIGNPVPELQVDNKIKAEKYGAFVSYTWKPVERLTTTTGIRLDYFHIMRITILHQGFLFPTELPTRPHLMVQQVYFIRTFLWSSFLKTRSIKT